MRLSLKLSSIFVMLLIVLVAPAYAAATQPSLVVVSGSVVISPGTVMAGDSGTVTITVMNSLKTPGVGDTHSTTDTINYGTSTSDNQAVSHSTQQMTSSSDASYSNAYLKTISLGNSGPIHVDPQQPQGTMLGMGDTVTYTFPFTVDSSAQDGLYQLLFRVTTTDDNVYLNYMVPVRVDNTPLKIYVNDAPTSFSSSMQSVTLDVVNNRANDVNSVSIEPSGDGYTFKPMQEYIIGNIGAGELYTAQINVASKNASNGVNPQFKVVYKNGNNVHETTPATVYVDNSGAQPASGGSGNGILYVIGIIVVALIIIGGLFWYLSRKRAKQ
jgi:hypothetical protein